MYTKSQFFGDFIKAYEYLGFANFKGLVGAVGGPFADRRRGDGTRAGSSCREHEG